MTEGYWDPDRFMRELQQDLAAMPRPSWWDVWVRNPVTGFLLGFLVACGIAIAASLLIPITNQATNLLLGFCLAGTLPWVGAAWGTT